MYRQRILKKRPIIAMCCISIIAIVITCFFTIGSKAEDSGATAISHGFATNNQVPTEVGEKGSPTNPTVILEIVPDMKFSQVGYMVAGCEPVDINKILNDIRNGNANAEQYMNDICSSGAAEFKSNTTTYKKFDLTSSDIASNWTYVNDKKMTQTGYYERVAEGTGNLVQTDVVKNSAGVITSASYTRQAKGNFVWVPYETSSLPATNHNAVNIGDRVYLQRVDNYYINYNYKIVSYTHKNTFLKNVLNVPDDKLATYNVVVKTITPSELNANNKWAERADLVLFTNKSYRSTLCTVYKSYSKIPYTDKGLSDDKVNFSNSNDLNWATVMKLYHKIAVDENRTGAVVDQTIFTEMLNSGTMRNVTVQQIGLDGNVVPNSSSNCMASNNNVFKLCLMLTTMNPQALYNLYFYNYQDGSKNAAVTEGTVDGRTTGVFNAQTGDAKTYWGVTTFMPPKLNGTVSSYSDWVSGESYATYETKTQLQYSNSTVNNHVYLFQSDMSLLDSLNNTGAIKADNLNKELFANLKEETGTTLTSTSPANAIRFVMAYAKDKYKTKPSINVLDLEPCTISSTLTSPKAYLTEAILRTKIVPMYTGKVNIVHQSTAEFIGKVDDLNTTYDLIYMGLYAGRLNLSNGSTVYNDSTLNGKIYLHVGDKVVSRNVNQHTVNWPTNMSNITRGPGNDITSLKKDALEDYLKAGLPIVAETDLYNANSLYIDPTSYIYKFVTSNNTNILSSSDTSLGSKVFANFKKTGLVLHMEEGDYPKEYVGTSTTGTIDSSAYISRTLSYKFTLEDSEYRSGTTYTAKLYIDISRDGIYSSDEVITTKTGLVADGTKYTITKTLGKNFVGAIPWKLVVTKDSNTSVRDLKQGFSAIQVTPSDKKVVKVLQINENSGSTLNLQQNVQAKGLFYKYTSKLNDYIFEFTTIDIKTFEAWYNSTSKFDKTAMPEAKVVQNKLKDYNMLIFGFADYYSNISNQYGALDNVMYFIDSGKSVLFTHDTTSFYNVASEQDKNLSTVRAYNFNVLFRDYLGMDRFGIRTTDPTLKATKDKATKPNGGTYNEIHGYTYQAVTKLGETSTTLNPYPLYTGSKFSSNTILTTKVAKLNGGQITEYPYRINDSFTIASTHSQYFQLDLNEKDMIVWYTLAQSDSNDNGYFSCSANDASSNYYIYSKGNVTYSGVGHSSMANNDMEVKLFVNTMIAAYQNGNEPPTVEVVNKGVYSKAPNDYSLYVSVDYAETSFSDEKYEEILFVPKNNSLVTDELYVKTTTADGMTMKVYDEHGTLINPDSNGYVKLYDGNTYSIRWPQSYLSDSTKKDITFNCYFIDDNGKSTFGASMAHLLRRNLFNLS